MLTLIEGPAGGGKSELARELIASGEVEVLADVTALWAAIAGVERGPDGRYPIRLDDDPALGVALYTQGVVARRGLEAGAATAVTTSRPGQAEKWSEVAEEAETEFSVCTVDPGEDVLTARLADPVSRQLSGACEVAIARWYGG